MKVTIIENCSYAPDKVNEKKLVVGEVCELPHRIAVAFIGHGYCKQFEKVNDFNPVVETAVVNPVEEVKEKTKRKRRSKKKAE